MQQLTTARFHTSTPPHHCHQRHPHSHPHLAAQSVCIEQGAAAGARHVNVLCRAVAHAACVQGARGAACPGGIQHGADGAAAAPSAHQPRGAALQLGIGHAALAAHRHLAVAACEVGAGRAGAGAAGAASVAEAGVAGAKVAWLRAAELLGGRLGGGALGVDCRLPREGGGAGHGAGLGAACSSRAGSQLVSAPSAETAPPHPHVAQCSSPPRAGASQVRTPPHVASQLLHSPTCHTNARQVPVLQASCSSSRLLAAQLPPPLAWQVAVRVAVPPPQVALQAVQAEYSQ